MGVKEVKVLNAGNARLERQVNGVANVVGVKEVKVLNAVNARLERQVNGVANVVGVKEVKVLNAVNARLERQVNEVANEVRVPSVVSVRPERVVNAVLVDHSSVGAVVRADQVVFCGCSQ